MKKASATIQNVAALSEEQLASIEEINIISRKLSKNVRITSIDCWKV